MNDWITIFETSQAVEAEIIRGVLESHGIEAVIMNQQDSSYRFGVIKVMINEDNKEKALEILENTND